MEKLHELKEKLWSELEELADKREMGAGDLEVVHKITDTIKKIDKICMLEEDGYPMRRDSRGRYSRDDGRSEMMEHLEMALDSASDQDRETIKRFIRQMENA